MNRKNQSAMRSLVLVTMLFVVVVSLACATFTPATKTPEPEPTPSPTPTATATPVPPRPVIPYTPVPSDMLAPILVQRSPKQGQLLAPDGTIELVFDKPMDHQTVAGALRIEWAGTTQSVGGTLSWANDRTVTFSPSAELPRDETFDVILTQDARASTGETLRQPYTFRFSTVGPLQVTQVIPATDTTDVETDAAITVMFSRPVVPLTTLQQMDTLPDPLTFEPTLAGNGEWLNTSIYVFRPETSLAGGITYKITVSDNLRDLSDAPLAEPYTWQFTTVPPKVLWVAPRQDATLVDINTAITVHFNQPIDAVSAAEAFSLRGSAILGGLARGTADVRGSTLIFTPTRPLEFDTRYTVRVDAGVNSTAGGKGMAQPYAWEFSTVPLPRIIETYPKNGNRNAPSHSEFRIVFNAPIDPATVMPNLTMTPPLSATQVHTYFSAYNNTFVLHFGAQPSTDYVVTITDGIADPYGNTIPRGRTVRFTTAQLPPTYQLRTPDFIGTYDAALPARLVIAHLNLDRLDLQLYELPISAIQEEPWQWQDRDRALPRNSLIRRWRETLPSPLNDQQQSVINLTEAPGGSLSPGVYLLDVEAPDLDRNSWRRMQRHILVVSELNLTLKTGPEETLVWALDLATGDPVPNLDLTVTEIYQGRQASITTDREGIARLELPRRHHSLMVLSETPFAAVASDWGRGISPWDFGVDGGLSSEDARAYIYTDRAIYRPGQTMAFKGVIRAEDDAEYSLPGISSVSIEIRGITGEILYNEILPVSDNGTFNDSLELGASASLGEYVISATFADHYSQTYFTVAAYRAPEFEIDVTSAAAEIRRGDALEITIEVAYFFGGPLKETPVTWNVLAESAIFEPPWGGQYTFSDTDDPYRCFGCWWYDPPATESLLSGTGTTDNEGRLAVTISGKELAEVLPTGTQRVVLEATAVGPDNQQISGRTSTTVHPGPFYIGLQPRKYVSQAGEDADIDLVAVDWKGQRLGGNAIRASLYRREWINTFVENDAGGGRWSWETRETWIDETIVTTDNLGEAVATFVPAEGGSYHVVAEPANPAAGTEDIRTAIFIWVSGHDTVAWRRENHDRITLVSDKSTYEVGETAEILIPSPLESPQLALVTVEREGIRRYDVLRLETNSTIYRLPIEAGDIPNIYVSVVLITPHGSGPAEFKMGLLPLDVNPAPKMLSVQVEADLAQAQPGEDVTFTVTTLDPDGQLVAGAELSLDVVDKAVLSLKPRTQDILSALYARRQLQIDTASGLSVSVNRYQEELDIEIVETQDVMAFADDSGMVAEALPMEAPAVMPTAVMGRGAAESEDKSLAAPPADIEVRESFADTAAWIPVIVTDQNGQASVTVTLPDNLTTWVARAVGLTADTVVGEGIADVVATKPLLIRPVTPRFFVVDDRAQLAANVANNTTVELEVEVVLSGAGLQISAETPAQQTVTIAPHGEAKVTWWTTVSDVAQVEVVFSATAGDFTDASKPRLTTGPDGSLLVLRYTAPDTVGTAGQLTEGGAQTEAIALPPEFDDRRGQLTVHLDPSLAAAMQEGLDYLEHYEYECTEQTVSRFLPNVLTYSALHSLGIDNPELAAKLPGLVEEGLAKLANQQNPDGGWGWWYRPTVRQSNTYVSAYVVFALLRAQEAGFAVESYVLDNGLNYLQSQVKGVRELDHYRDANRQGWLLYVLAEGNAVDRADIDTLYENRQRLSSYAQAYLAQAIWLDNPADARLNTLLSDLNNAAILSATGTHWEESHHDWWAMNTDTRSTAIILDTFARLDPDNALIPNAVRWLMVARKVGIWETTQETAWALIALTDWMVETGELDASFDFGLYLNDVEKAVGTATRETVAQGVTTVIPISDLDPDATNALTIARTDGSGRLYYTAHLQVYLPVENIEAEDRGFIVQRKYTLASCEAQDRRECPEVDEAKLGDVIRVDLTIISPHDRYYVVVEDPLPAGGEAVDTGLVTTSLLAMGPSLQRESSRYWWWWHWYSRSEIRDEKVVLFADTLAAGTYEYSYTFRATLPGDYHVIPATASEFYFPEVFGRSDGRLFTVTE